MDTVTGLSSANTPAPADQAADRQGSLLSLRLRPSVLLTLGMLITVAVVISLVWSGQSVYRQMRDAVEATALMDEVRHRVRHLDEALSVSVRMAVTTGDLYWDTRYRALEADMDQALDSVRRPLISGSWVELPADLLAANAELVAMEHRILNLVRNGERERAEELFHSPAFARRREVYLGGLRDLSESLAQVSERLVERVSSRVRLQTIGGLLVLAALVAGWLVIYRILSRVERRTLVHQWNLQRKTEDLAREVGDREQAERELREVTALQNAILNSANYSVISTDPDGTIRTFNATAERLLGYRADEVVGKVTPALIHDDREVERRAEELERELGECIEPGFEVFVAHAKRGYADEREWTYVRKDGSRFPVLLSVTAIRDEQGAVTGYLGVASDITERKRVERMKDEFISTVSHELRTPLTSICGSLGLLQGGVGGELNPKAQELVAIANSNSERLTLLINDILDMEKIEAGKMDFELRPLQIMPAVERALREIKAYGRQFGVGFSLVPGDRALMVNVDPDRLAQVLSNLLSNAAKFSPRGEEVTVEVEGLAESVRVSVTDRGAGIPQEFRDRVFEKFSQADGSNTRQMGGTGLGLNICKAIVTQMGGRIDFRSQAGQGSTFYFELPRWGASEGEPREAAL
jgi:PAS domain S-box-containing protein